METSRTSALDAIPQRAKVPLASRPPTTLVTELLELIKVEESLPFVMRVIPLLVIVMKDLATQEV